MTRGEVDGKEGGDGGDEREESGGKKTWAFPTPGGCWVTAGCLFLQTEKWINNPMDLGSASTRINVFLGIQPSLYTKQTTTYAVTESV